MIITIDVDGVVAAMDLCDFDKSIRNATTYYAKPPHPGLNLNTLNRLIAEHQVYFVSARSFPNATLITRKWLAHEGVNVEDCYGVICTEGLPCEGGGTESKPTLVEWLGSSLHIDDHPQIIQALDPSRACLFYNPSYESNSKLFDSPQPFALAKNWTDISNLIKEKTN